MEPTLEKRKEKEMNKVSIEGIGIKAGVLIWISLVIYFILMKSSSLIESELAWAFNTIILGAGLMLMYRYFRSKTQLTVDYLPGLTLGIIATVVSVVLFSLTLYFWLSRFDTTLLELLKKNTLFMGGEAITPFKVAASVVIEGGCSGLLISYMLMQYYKSGFRRKAGEELMEG